VTQSYEQLFCEGYVQLWVRVHLSALNFPMTCYAQLLLSLPRRLLLHKSSCPHTLRSGDRCSWDYRTQCPISFRYGRPAFDQFPMKLWRKLLSRHCRSNSDWLDYATNPSGHNPYGRRSPLPSRSRAVQCDPDQVMLTNGAASSVSSDAPVDRSGDAIALEDPGYLSADLFLSQGNSTCSRVRVGCQGVR